MASIWRWTWGRRLSRTAAGERIYAIGDVHGACDTLIELLRLIDAHSAALPPVKRTRIILLGDLIDRGPASREVLEHVCRSTGSTRPLIALKGNHEDMLLRVLDREITVQRLWLSVGGDATLASFGLSPPEPEEHPWQLAHRLREAMGDELIDFVRAMPVWTRSGDYLFVHAGIRPGVALRRQKPSEMMWIRDEFLDDTSDHGVTVVHGHSTTYAVDLQPYRIGIDTGAHLTGKLSAIYLEDAKREIISTAPHSCRVEC